MMVPFKIPASWLTDYASIFVEFREAVSNHTKMCMECKVLDSKDLEFHREKVRLSEINLLVLFNKILTKLQRAGL